MKTILFKNDVIEATFLSTDPKGIIVNATARHPETDEVKTIGAGWISETWFLHSFAKTPKYIFDVASVSVHENILKIAESVLNHIQEMHNKCIEEWEKSDSRKNDATIEYNGRIEPKFGKADVLRYTYKQRFENLEYIKNEREEREFYKTPSGVFNNNKRMVSR